MEKIKRIIVKKGPIIIKIIFIVLVVNFIISSVKNNITKISFSKTIDLLSDFNKLSIFLLIILGNIVATSVIFFDYYLVRYYGLKIKKITIFYTSYISSALNNIFGFGGLTGIAIRNKYFKVEDIKLDILDYSLLLMPVPSAGLSIWSLFLPLFYTNISEIIKTHSIIFAVLIIFIVYFPLYFVIDILVYKLKRNKSNLINIKRFKLKIKLIITSALNWLLTLILFAIILWHFERDIKFSLIFSIFILASISGTISMIPGGIGLFDLIIILGFQNFQIPSESVIATLVLFRIFDYLIPFVVSIFLYLRLQGSYHLLLKNKNQV